MRIRTLDGSEHAVDEASEGVMHVIPVPADPAEEEPVRQLEDYVVRDLWIFEKRFRRDGDTEGRGELHRAPCVLRQVRVDLLRQEPIEVFQGHQRIERRMMGLLEELEE